ncbi:MAG: hypothetical protein H8D22_06585, partial [Candidatus Cloacimonetes bacterium]|nr:hypothetical protein [Candidatus Cloacimonadota bacterium]
IEDEQYIQCALLELDKFISFCREREVIVTKSQLEFFEKKKLFFPILRIKKPKYKEKIETTPNNQIRSLGPLKPRERYKGEIRERYSIIYFEKDYLKWLKEKGYISITKDKKFIPWKNFFDSKLQERSIMSYYSQFQIFWLYELLQRSSIKLGLVFFDGINKENSWEKIKSGKIIINAVKRNFQKRINDYYKLTEILIAIQNRYYPYTKSDERMISVSFPSSHINWDWNGFKKKWDPLKTQKTLGFDFNYLKKCYQNIISTANFKDPIKHWYTFIQFISYEKKKKLKGQALLAQDFYGMAKMLKMFIKDLTGESLPSPDEGYYDWKKKYYGKETLENKLEFLEYLCNAFHVNPRPKLILVVEGYGEYENIPRLSKAIGLDLNLTGIRIENLKGIGNFKNLENFIDHYHSLQTVVYVLLDNENNTRQFKQKILKKDSKYGISRKKTKSEYIKIWDNNFEFDNFTNKEIAKAMTKQSQGKYTFSEKEINIVRNRNRKIEDIYKENVGFDLNKREFDKDLSNIIIKEIEQRKSADIINIIRENRKVVNEIIKIREIALKNYFPVRKELWKKNQESGFFGDIIK